jgi:hypothetical protein
LCVESIKWLPPIGWVELNTDGVSTDDGSVGCGGVLRDINGVLSF